MSKATCLAEDNWARQSAEPAKWLLRPPMCFAVTLEYRIGTATLENLERNPATLSGGG